MNPPIKSKINWTSVIVQVVTLLFLAGLIPEKYEDAVIALIGLLAPTVVQIFRTWYTEKKNHVG